jgi:hypothetical protein
MAVIAVRIKLLLIPNVSDKKDEYNEASRSRQMHSSLIEGKMFVITGLPFIYVALKMFKGY